MILSDQELRSVQAERSVVVPWNLDHLQPASIDLTLNGDVIRQYYTGARGHPIGPPPKAEFDRQTLTRTAKKEPRFPGAVV